MARAGAMSALDCDISMTEEHPPLVLKTEPDEERRDRVEVCDGDAHVVEASCVWHGPHPPTTRLVDPLQGRGRPGGLDIGHEDFKTRHISGAEALGNHASSSRAVAWPRG